jgi:Tfp pilus assembly PilM family ATPase
MALTKETIVGLDIGPEQVSMAQVEVRGVGNIHLVNAGWVPLTPGLDTEGTASLLREMWKECRLSCFTVASCLRSPAVVVRHFRFPSLNDNELTAALTLEAEEVLQLDADRIVMDWHENLVHAAPSDSRGREGVLVAVPEAELTRHQQMLEAAGLLPVIVDVGCTALGNIFMGLRGAEHRDSAVCLVNLSGRTADVAILFDGNAMYPRCLTNGGDGDGRIRFLADNLNDVLKYYQFKLRREPVTEIIVTGQAPDMAALCAQLQQRVRLPVSAWDPSKALNIRNWRVRQLLDHHPAQGMTLATAIGMAMRK